MDAIEVELGSEVSGDDAYPAGPRPGVAARVTAELPPTKGDAALEVGNGTKVGSAFITTFDLGLSTAIAEVELGAGVEPTLMLALGAGVPSLGVGVSPGFAPSFNLTFNAPLPLSLLSFSLSFSFRSRSLFFSRSLSLSFSFSLSGGAEAEWDEW